MDSAKRQTLHDLPHPVLEHVLLHVAQLPYGRGASALLCLACCDRYLRQAITDCPEHIWQAALDACCAHRPPIRAMASLAPPSLQSKPRALLQLACFSSCMQCKGSTAQFSKVYWEYGVRCCAKCLKDNTISHKQLWSEYRLEEHHCADLAHISRHRTTPGVMSRSAAPLRFYWRQHLLPVLRRVHGVASLQAAREKAQQAAAAEAAAERSLTKGAPDRETRAFRALLTPLRAFGSRGSTAGAPLHLLADQLLQAAVQQSHGQQQPHVSSSAATSQGRSRSSSRRRPEAEAAGLRRLAELYQPEAPAVRGQAGTSSTTPAPPAGTPAAAPGKLTAAQVTLLKSGLLAKDCSAEQLHAAWQGQRTLRCSACCQAAGQGSTSMASRRLFSRQALLDHCRDAHGLAAGISSAHVVE
jgi:hypothetical protein